MGIRTLQIPQNNSGLEINGKSWCIVGPPELLSASSKKVQHPEYGEPFIGNTNAGEVPGVGASGKPGETPYLEVS